MKKDILIFCSWLNVDSNVGVFFSEQAAVMSGFYNPTLIVFKPFILSKRRFNYFKRTQILEKKSKEGLLILEVHFATKNLLGKRINSYFEDIAIKKLHTYLLDRKISASFIHAHSIFDAGIWAYKYSCKHQIPYLITEHNQLSFLGIDREKSALALKALENSALNLVVSNDKIRQFAANGLFYNFKNIGNLVSNEFFLNLETSKSTKIRLITIGAFSSIKDHLTLLKALNIVDSQLKQRIEFVWIGHNSWGINRNSAVDKLLLDFKFENIDVILESLLPRKDVATYLNSSHLFLFSSLSEGMPVSVLEALACGLPVFSSNCGGVDEFITGQNGKIYQIKDYQNLAILIIDFINQGNSYNADIISKNILDKYGVEAFRKKLLSHYKEVENRGVI